MPKSFDDEFSPATAGARTGPSELDQAAVRDLMSAVEEMLGDARGRWEWAEDTLQGIYSTVEERGWVTEAQKRAVDNIRARVEDRG